MKYEKAIVRTSIISIIVNILLSVFKAVVGLISNSIAIILDAVNNITDALSSIITIIGTRIASKAPDKEHPYGHGRLEYLTATFIAIIIIYAGGTSLIEAIKKIIHPEVPDYSMVTIFLLLVAIITKIVLGTFVKKKGEQLNSHSLVNSGVDALLDAIISFSTLVAAVVFLSTGVSLEAYLAVIISIIIIRSGIMMIKETTSQILGERVDSKISLRIKKVVNAFDEVNGVYDLVLNNYGPDIYMGSLHIEVSEKLNAVDIDHLTRKITNVVFDKCGVIITAVGIYSYNEKDKECTKIRKKINDIVEKYPSILQMHGFYVNKQEKDINFDLVIDFNEKDKVLIYKKVLDEVSKALPDYHIYIVLDSDISD